MSAETQNSLSIMAQAPFKVTVGSRVEIFCTVSSQGTQATDSIQAKKILIVDDLPDVCESIRMLLEADGHEVLTANDGHEALRTFESGQFDALITDLVMPGMQGDELARLIREKSPQIRIIMVTAHAEIIGGNPPTGVDRLVSKPFRHQDLRDALA